MPRPSLCLTLLILLTGGCGDPTAEEPAVIVADDAHARDVEQWRLERRESLEQPDGWFSLVGLFWLEDGESTCGSDPSSNLRLPESVPARVGVFHRSESGVEFVADPDAGVLVDGQATARNVPPEGGKRYTLATDAEGEPTVVVVGSVRLYLIDRDGRVGVRVKDSQSPALLAFAGLDNFAVDSRWRTEARFVPYDPPRQIAVPTVLGTIAEQPSPGAVEFELAASPRRGANETQSHRLDVLPGGDDQYFIVFGDASNGKETYGGGRFLYAAAADEAGRVVLDFNQAYNPPCAFTPYATCPLPPRQNRLALAVHAGEKNYAGGTPH